jgi:hypothetical protein
MRKLRIALVASCLPFFVAGCGKSVEEKMGAICEDVVKASVVDPSALVFNSVSAKPQEASKESLLRFSGLRSGGKLDADQQQALQNLMLDMSKVKEAFVQVDFTDKAGVARRDNAVCWFMDTGHGFELGSASVLGKRYVGIDIVALFVNRTQPEYLDDMNRVR